MVTRSPCGLRDKSSQAKKMPAGKQILVSVAFGSVCDIGQMSLTGQQQPVGVAAQFSGKQPFA
jgi:hypothetical protein